MNIYHMIRILFPMLFLMILSLVHAQSDKKFAECTLVYSSGIQANCQLKRQNRNIFDKTPEVDDYISKVEIKYPGDNRIQYIPVSLIASLTVDGTEYDKVCIGGDYPDTAFMLKSSETPMKLYSYITHFRNAKGYTSCIRNYILVLPDRDVGVRAANTNCDGSRFMVTQDISKEAFSGLFRSYPELQKKIKDKTYDRKDIELIVREYNMHYELTH
jgi:hypothetical protein